MWRGSGSTLVNADMRENSLERRDQNDSGCFNHHKIRAGFMHGCHLIFADNAKVMYFTAKLALCASLLIRGASENFV